MGINAKTNRFIKATVIAAIVGLCIFAQPAFATEIGNTGNFIPGNNGVYDITPETLDGNVGFRQYEKFNLDNGDVANLIFKQGGNNIETFVNLVDNTININGIVNTMRDGAFYNGNAVFISPNGMVVGPTGVLNVGSLGVYVPTTDEYSYFKTNPRQAIGRFNEISPAGQVVLRNGQRVDSNAVVGDAVIQIDGKVFTSNSLKLISGSININENAGLMSGVQDMYAINQASVAEAIFNQLVNTSNITEATEIGEINGKLLMYAADLEGTGINISGQVKSFNVSEYENVGLNSYAGMKIASTGNVSGEIVSYDIRNGDLILQGQTIAQEVAISNYGSDIIVGDASVDKQVTAENSIYIYGVGNILATPDKGPNGESKTHFVSNGTLYISIHKNIGDTDIGASVNTKVMEYIDVTAGNIYMASIDADMKVAKANAIFGDVTLIADSAVKGETPYSILNGLGKNKYVTVIGKTISLIASGGIGTDEMKFNIMPTSPEYDVNILAKTGDINLQTKANDAKFGTVIAKEGSANLLFTGNADITEITAAKNINVVAEGKTLKIENLGSLPNTPTDYYGANSEIAPKNVKLTALDIANGETLDANSEVIVTNGRVQSDSNPNVDEITIIADNAYINGKHVVLNDSDKVVKDDIEYVRFTNVSDDRTNTIQSVDNNEITIGTRAVAEDDVVALKSGVPTTISGPPIAVLIYMEEPEDVFIPGTQRNYYVEDILPPEPVVINNNEDEVRDDEGKRTYQRKSDDDDVAIVDKRQYMRFSISDNRNLVELESNPLVDSLIDISRGGVAIKHHKSLKVGDIVPIQLSFGGLDIDANVKIVTATDVRAGAEFVDLDHATANKLLYLNILLQEAYGGNSLIKIK